VLALLATAVIASSETVGALFSAGRYEDAREALEVAGGGFRQGEETFWRTRLEEDPAKAALMLRETLGGTRLPETVRTRLALDLADIEFGRGRYKAAIEALTPVLESDQSSSLPGEVYLRAGLSLRAVGDLQLAREMLASVRPHDPVFLLARYYLGDIGLEQNNVPLARNYFESAAKASPQEGGSRLGAGLWRAHMAQGEAGEADKVVEQLERTDPGGLALLEIKRLQRDRSDELEAMTKGQIPDSTAAPAPAVAVTGRYTLQLGAFSDRRLALEFQKRYRNDLPDLRIDQVRDERGQFLYKVRTGSFVNPALARTEARRLADSLDIEVIVSDMTGTAGSPD
jgi:tetratricopeptide (TPR) repeat protein